MRRKPSIETQIDFLWQEKKKKSFLSLKAWYVYGSLVHATATPNFSEKNLYVKKVYKNKMLEEGNGLFSPNLRLLGL